MRLNLITRLKEEWNNLDPVDPLRGLIADAIDALTQPAQQHIEHCLWARNGNQPCPHVQPAKQQNLQELWHKVWPDAGAFVRASADDLTQFAKAVSAYQQPAQQPHCDDCGGFDPECPLAQPAQPSNQGDK